MPWLWISDIYSSSGGLKNTRNSVFFVNEKFTTTSNFTLWLLFNTLLNLYLHHQLLILKSPCRARDWPDMVGRVSRIRLQKPNSSKIVEYVVLKKWGRAARSEKNDAYRIRHEGMGGVINNWWEGSIVIQKHHNLLPLSTAHHPFETSQCRRVLILLLFTIAKRPNITYQLY